MMAAQPIQMDKHTIKGNDYITVILPEDNLDYGISTDVLRLPEYGQSYRSRCNIASLRLSC